MSVPRLPEVNELFPYYKFTSCCNNTEIYFTGSLAIASGSPYKYIGLTPFVGTGGTLQPGFCYTVELLISQDPLTYPIAPSTATLQLVGSCEDKTCAPCTTTNCSCPERYIKIDGECVETIVVNANYTGTTVTLNQGNKSNAYSKFGLRLYPDITANPKPLVGNGSPYSVIDNNGTGVTITPLISSLQSTLWGCQSPTACSTFVFPSSSYGGRLNIAGLWNEAYNASGDGPELSFEYCIEIAESKQYLIGIAGDNKVKLYVDGILNVFLNAPPSTSTVPFNYWHVFPITLTAGTHIIRLSGINTDFTSAAFAAEIYNIDLATFQSTLTIPALGLGNCGNTVSDLEPYIIFSTENMIGLNVPDPNTPGEWECPEGYTLDECDGVPVCTIETRFDLICPCYLLIPCDGVTPPFISNTEALNDYVNQFVSVSYGEFNGCVYVVNQDDTSCENSVTVTINPETVCDCETVCYYIENAKGITYIQYIDESDDLLQISPAESAPWITLCSKVYPILSNTNNDYTITALGSCTDNLCEQKCFKLIDCLNSENILYSNSYTLITYAINEKVVKIAGHTECWTVEITEDDCDCAIDVIVTSSSVDCETCKTLVAYKLTSCDNTYAAQYTYQNLSEYVNKTVLTDCGCFIVELINFAPPSVQNIVVLTSFDNCKDCKKPYYKLSDCNTDNEIYTFSDLSQYVDQVVKIANCHECWTVTETNIPINPGLVTVVSFYIDCITCVTTAPCICSNVRNDNAIAYTYNYVDCYGDTQSVTVQPGQTSPRICLIKWLEPEACNCFIQTTTVGTTVTNVIRKASGNLINHKPVWYIGNVLFVYYNGTQWIMNDSLGNPEYYLSLPNLDCPTGTWKPFSSIPQELPTTVSTVSCLSFYQFFGDCNNGICPTVVYPKKSIKPGYNTPVCSTEKYEEISCKSAEILYKQVLTLRYGISNCCPEDNERWLIKKELIDLAALYNPEYECTITSCGCMNTSKCGCSSSNINTCNS